MFRHLVIGISLIGVAAVVSGCHSPGGGMMPQTGGSHTYTSDEMTQKSVYIIDVRNNQKIFAIDIPPGKQLTIDFDDGVGDDPVYTPDLLRWELWDKGTTYGKLRNVLSVPNAASRRVDVEVRQDVQYAKGAAPRMLRTDETIDRPSWWTPEGGELPEDRAVDLYDD